MKKTLFSFAFFIVLTFTWLNLGKYLDVTQKPVKSDIIVCLGGGTIDRVKKTIELFEKGYVEKNVLLLLGESWYNQPYIKSNYPALSVDIVESPKNTKEEVLFIKQYMKEHGYTSAMIVTDPPHSRRVNLLTSLVSTEGDETLTFYMIGSDVKWWDKEYYYKSEQALTFVKNESMGIFYSFIAYGVLDKIGLLDEFEAWRKGRES